MASPKPTLLWQCKKAQLFHPFVWTFVDCLAVAACLPPFLLSSVVKLKEQIYWYTEVTLLSKVA